MTIESELIQRRDKFLNEMNRHRDELRRPPEDDELTSEDISRTEDIFLDFFYDIIIIFERSSPSVIGRTNLFHQFRPLRVHVERCGNIISLTALEALTLERAKESLIEGEGEPSEIQWLKEEIEKRRDQNWEMVTNLIVTFHYMADKAFAKTKELNKSQPWIPDLFAQFAMPLSAVYQ